MPPGVLLIFLAACRPDDKVSSSESGEDPAVTELGAGKLQGRVWTTDGAAVSNAEVSVGARKTTTNNQGFFTLESLPEGTAVVRAEAEGYSSTGAVRELQAETWAYVDLRVAPAEVLSWDPLAGGLLETADEVQVSLGALVDTFGERVTGPVDVSVTLVNSAEMLDAAPGELMADRDGQDALLETLGMVEVRLSDAAGLPVQLAEPAELSFPVADREDQEGFGLFGYDADAGRWSELGGGVVEDGRFQVEVDHFSWWNCDRFANTDQCVTGTLVAGGQVVAGATITVFAEESSLLTSGSFTTDADGSFTIDLPTGASVQLSLKYGAYTWESEPVSLPQGAVSASDRPEGCVDLGEVVARSADEDEDDFPSAERGGPDCDDGDATINPGAVDTAYSGVDEDCGGEDDYDRDQDGYVPAAYVGRPTRYVDGSGALPGGDCDDTDFWTNPGRVDYCDGHDDNCSGDESDASDITTWYQDQDMDGYGTDASATTACASPGDAWVTEGGDCDDEENAPGRFYPGADEACGALVDYNCDGSVATANNDGDAFLACDDCDDADPLIYPGATEICDGQDNDCDGTTDDDAVDIKIYSLDYDADGYGDATTTYTGCSVPDGYVEITGGAGDCDDLDAARYPGAVEICEDGLVQDCEGSEVEAVAVCIWSGELDLSDAELKMIGETAMDEAGNEVSAAGDVNADGYADLIVGVASHGESRSGVGTAYVVLGGASGDLSLSEADAKLIGEAWGDQAGSSASTADDMDADGYADLLVGAYYQDAGGNYSGAAYLVLGPVSGELNLSDADAKLIGEASGDYAGQSSSTAGDVDADGHPDLFVGALHNDGGGEMAGAAYLVLGPVSGELDLSDADAKLIGEAPDDLAGISVSTAGDADADGHADLLIGAVRHEAGGPYSGAAYLVLGPVSGELDLSDADAKLIGEDVYDYAGGSVSTAGDVDADGHADLFVGARFHSTDKSNVGVAYLVLGPVSGELDLSDADAKLIGAMESDNAGGAVSTAGDVNADGHADLLVGAVAADGGGSYSGAAYLVLGPVSGEVDLSEADAEFIGEEAIDYAGSAVSTAGDVNADGLADLVVGAYGQDAGASDAGAAYLLLSSSF